MLEYFTRREPKSQPDYEEKYWGTIVDPDGKIRNRLEEREQFLEDIKQELDYLNNLSTGRLLEIGCGPGFLLSGLKPEFEKHAVEVSKFAAEYAGQWGEIFVGTLKDANYPDEHFKIAVMHHVIEHIDDPISTIKEVFRILKPDGKFLISTPDFDCACARRFGENFRLLHDPTHVSLFSNDSMHRFLRDHGFTIEKAEYPFFETRHFTPENLMRMLDTTQISPPFYGNFMTFYCHKELI